MPSTVIAHYKYDAAGEILTVNYLSGRVYQYLQVPKRVYKEMRSAMSKGVFLNRNIKGKYDFKEIK